MRLREPALENPRHIAGTAARMPQISATEGCLVLSKIRTAVRLEDQAEHCITAHYCISKHLNPSLVSREA